MRLLKLFSLIFIALFIVLTIALTITYNARVAVINQFIKTQPNLAQLNVNCLALHLASDLSITIDKLCLQTAQADIEIMAMRIQWQNLAQIKITYIEISSVDIKGTKALFVKEKNNESDNNKPRDKQSDKQLLLTTLRPYIKKINQLQLPIKVNITKISYLPFTLSKQTRYTASLSAIDNTVSFSVHNAEKITFLKAKLKLSKSKSENKAGFSLVLSTKLKLLKNFIVVHQPPITKALQSVFKDSDVSAKLDSVIEYQADSLSIKNKISDIVIKIKDGTNNSGAFNVSGALSFQSQLNFTTQKLNNSKSKISAHKDDEIALTFSGINKISLAYQQAQLIALLKQNKVSPTIIAIVNDNPFAHLTVNFPDKTILRVNKQKVYLSHIAISAQSEQRSHQVKLNDISFAIPTNKTPLFNTFSLAKFVIDSQLNLANTATALNKLTNNPVVLHLAGSLAKNEKEITLNLTDNSAITLDKIMLLKPASEAKKHTTKILTVKRLTAKLTGSIQVLTNNSVTLNLKLHSQASHLNIAKTVQLKSLNFFSDIQGTFADIHINTTTQADGVDLGRIIVSGSALSPQIEIIANQLPLTDLLSLKMQLPIKIALIDGLLTYRIKGQLTDLSAIEQTPFAISISATSVSGEINGLWLQELNWQQNFTLLSSKINTQPNTAENLTIALIGTPVPITKLSMNINGAYNKTFKLYVNKLKGDLLGGNFYIPTVQWPFKQERSVDVQLNSIDLAQVLALDKRQGIVVTGNISGQIPVTFDGKKYIIEKGELHNINNGLIQVMNNPAVANLKANNSELQLAFDALQNLHYHQLSSAVSLNDDGYMLLKTVIKGYNPDINDDVNLNLNLNYDLLGLLESLSITERFENNLIKGLRKH